MLYDFGIYEWLRAIGVKGFKRVALVDYWGLDVVNKA